METNVKKGAPPSFFRTPPTALVDSVRFQTYVVVLCCINDLNHIICEIHFALYNSFLWPDYYLPYCCPVCMYSAVASSNLQPTICQHYVMGMGMMTGLRMMVKDGINYLDDRAEFWINMK